MSTDLTAALDAMTRQAGTEFSRDTLTGAVNYGAGGANDIGEALDKLTRAAGATTRENKALPPKKTAPPIPQRVGNSQRITSASGSGGGIASPLSEPSYAARTFWPDQTIVSTDGIFAFRIAPLKQIVLADAASASVVVNLAQPTP